MIYFKILTKMIMYFNRNLNHKMDLLQIHLLFTFLHNNNTNTFILL